MPPKKRGAAAKSAKSTPAKPAITSATPRSIRSNGAATNGVAHDIADPAEQPTPVAKRGRGRPSMKKSEPEMEEEDDDVAPVHYAPVAESKKRGRPARTSVRGASDTVVDDAPQAPASGKKRGRPSLKSQAAEPEEEEEVVEEEAEVIEPPKKRGRPSKTTAPVENGVEPATKKRGRPAKAKATEDIKDELVEEAVPAEEEFDEEAENVEKPAAKKRGRKAKAEPEPAVEEDALPKKRGRPAKAAAKAETESEPEPAPDAGRRGRPAKTAQSKPTDAPSAKTRGGPSKTPKPAATKAAPKKRGRSAKETLGVEDDDEEPATKRQARGRPNKQQQQVEVEEDFDDADMDEEQKAPKKTAKKAKAPAKSAGGRGRGRPKKAVEAVDQDMDDSNDVNPTEATTEIAGDNEVMDDEDDRQYWLMKAEPDRRVETTASGKQVDVKFTIDDLRAKAAPEPWEGIRNLQAQKNMRAMNVGDLAFFYESNCKHPGIIGVMEIVEEASVDQAAFSQDSPYYDPKSDPNKPKWQLVHVAFRRKFSEKITLKEIQGYGKAGGVLEHMQLLKQSRLSVSRVEPKGWRFILSLVKGDSEDEEDAIPETQPEVDDGAFASAFEAPATLSHPADAVSEVMSDAIETAAAIASRALGDKNDDNIEVRDVTNESVRSVSVSKIVPAISSPSIPDAALPSTEVNTDAFVTFDHDDGEGHGLMNSIRSAIGFGKRSTSRAPSAKPASRATSRAPSIKASSRAGSRVPSVRISSRAGSLAPSNKGKTPVKKKTARYSSVTDDEYDLPDMDVVEEGDEDADEDAARFDEALAKPLSYA